MDMNDQICDDQQNREWCDRCKICFNEYYCKHYYIIHGPLFFFKTNICKFHSAQAVSFGTVITPSLNST